MGGSDGEGGGGSISKDFSWKSPPLSFLFSLRTMSHPFSPFAQASKEEEEEARAAPGGRRLRNPKERRRPRPKMEREASM